jgi:peptidyl-tRNA hydrolase ICT1
MKRLPCPILFGRISTWIKEFNFNRIPLKYLKWSFSKSSGPGGQNVNKLNSKVTLSVTPHIDWLPIELLSKIGNNPLIFKSDIHRYQHFNQRECQESLSRYLNEQAIEVAPPPPSVTQQARVAYLEAKSNNSRKMLKKYLSQKKQDRKRPPSSDVDREPP